MILVELPTHWRMRALVLAAPDDARMWLTPEEFRESEQFRTPRRGEEWRDSRVAAKMCAVINGHGSDPQKFRIERPYIYLDGPDEKRFISISHSSPFVGAAIDTVPVGIDVQVLRDISERAAHLFLQDDEIDVMQRCTLPYRMLHFWAAKEAAFKRRSDEFTTLRQVPLSVEKQNTVGLVFDQVETFATEDLIVALTRSDGGASASLSLRKNDSA